MTQMKLKQLMRLIANLEGVIKGRLAPGHKKVAQSLVKDLELLLLGAENTPHVGPCPLRHLKASVTDTLRIVQQATGEKLVLIGGAAVIHWVQIRETKDLDYVVLTRDLPKVKSLFPKGQNKPLMYTVNVEGVDVDFMHSEHFRWAGKTISTAVNTAIMGISTKVALPEYLILFKLQAGRDRDESDIKALLTLKGVSDRAKPLVEKYLPDFLEDFSSLTLAAEYGL